VCVCVCVCVCVRARVCVCARNKVCVCVRAHTSTHTLTHMERRGTKIAPTPWSKMYSRSITLSLKKGKSKKYPIFQKTQEPIKTPKIPAHKEEDDEVEVVG
jgi:hypothetical protein